MIEDAEERGLISPGATTLVEPTSGNMGIALAYIALARGYRFVAVMPAEYSLDKQILLRYLGADLVLTGKEVKVAAHRHRCPLVSRLQDWPARLYHVLKSNIKCHAVFFFRSCAWLPGTARQAGAAQERNTQRACS